MIRWDHDASAFADLLENAAAVLRSSPYRDHSFVRLPRRGRLLVTGDIHDNVSNFDAVVFAAELCKSSRNHVVLHELIHSDRVVDGLDRSYRMLGYLAELIVRYPLQVHPVLANHEIAQCRKQQISKGAGNNVEHFDAGLDWAFGEGAQVASDAISLFIHAMPLAIRCDNGLMVSHSLPADNTMHRMDLRVFQRELSDEDFDGPDGAAYLLTWGRTHAPEHLTRLAYEWSVKAFLVGHSHVPGGVGFREPNMVILNTDHDEARVLVVDLERDCPEASVLATRTRLVHGAFDGVLEAGDA